MFTFVRQFRALLLPVCILVAMIALYVAGRGGIVQAVTIEPLDGTTPGIRWARTSSTSEEQDTGSIVGGVLDSNDNLYMPIMPELRRNGVFTFPNGLSVSGLSFNPNSAYGSPNALFVKFNPSGDPVWALPVRNLTRAASTSEADASPALANDGTDDTFWFAAYSQKSIFENIVLPSTAGAPNGFITRITPNGDAQLTVLNDGHLLFVGASAKLPVTIDTVTENGAVPAESYYSAGVMARISSLTGTVEWIHVFGGTEIRSGDVYSVRASQRDSIRSALNNSSPVPGRFVALSGQFRGTIQCGPYVLQAVPPLNLTNNKNTYFMTVDVETGEIISAFAVGGFRSEFVSAHQMLPRSSNTVCGLSFSSPTVSLPHSVSGAAVQLINAGTYSSAFIRLNPVTGTVAHFYRDLTLNTVSKKISGHTIWHTSSSTIDSNGFVQILGVCASPDELSLYATVWTIGPFSFPGGWISDPVPPFNQFLIGFVRLLASNGSIVWMVQQQTWNGMLTVTPLGLDSSGYLVITGGLRSTESISFGASVVPSTGTNEDSFWMSIRPGGDPPISSMSSSSSGAAAPGNATYEYSEGVAHALAAHTHVAYCGISYPLANWDCDFCKLICPRAGILDLVAFSEATKNAYGYLGYHPSANGMNRLLGEALADSIVLVFRGTDNIYTYDDGMNIEPRLLYSLSISYCAPTRVADGVRTTNRVDEDTNGHPFDFIPPKSWTHFQVPTSTMAYLNLPNGGVHSGFAKKYAALRATSDWVGFLYDVILARRATLKHIYVAGHSQGGALAVLAVLDVIHYLRTHDDARMHAMAELVQCYTFGQPRVFDPVAAAAMDGILPPDRFYRVASKYDGVPNVPFRWNEYCHSGTEVFLDPALGYGVIVPRTSEHLQECSGQESNIGNFHTTGVNPRSDEALFAHRNYYPHLSISLLYASCPTPVCTDEPTSCSGHGTCQHAFVDVTSIPARCICNEVLMPDPNWLPKPNTVTSMPSTPPDVLYPEWHGVHCELHRTDVPPGSRLRLNGKAELPGGRWPGGSVSPPASDYNAVLLTSPPISIHLPGELTALFSDSSAVPPIDRTGEVQAFVSDLAAAIGVARGDIQVLSFASGSIVTRFTITESLYVRCTIMNASSAACANVTSANTYPPAVVRLLSQSTIVFRNHTIPLIVSVDGSCQNGRQDSNEDGVDCGSRCAASCLNSDGTRGGLSVSAIVGITIAAALVIILAAILIWKLYQSLKSTLKVPSTELSARTQV